MTDRMTEAEIAELNVRRTNRDGTAEVLCTKAFYEITALRAEVERLNGIEVLYKAGCAAWDPVFKVVLDERDALRAEVEKYQSVLRAWQSRAAKAEAEVEKLRAALDWIANVPGSNLAECVNRARAALKEKT